MINSPKTSEINFNKSLEKLSLFNTQKNQNDSGSIWSSNNDIKFNLNESVFEAKKQENPEKVKPETKNPFSVNTKQTYVEKFADYQPTNKVKYNKVMTHVDKKVDTAKAKAVANMVCSLSDKYGLDPEITVAILERETGGYNFTSNVMVHKGSKYKGVMQVDKTTIECLYANPKDANNKRLSSHQRAVAYDHGRHYNYDQDRIDELKKQYPEVDDLYKAIQKDVSLGVEVGIMAYKGKLSVAKGDTRKALACYCGNQYRLPSDSTALRKIYPIPTYKDV